MRHHRLTPREKVQVIASLRYWGRAAEIGVSHPSKHPMIAARFHSVHPTTQKVTDILPLTLDELETLIGHLDGTWTGRGLRTWDGFRYL